MLRRHSNLLGKRWSILGLAILLGCGAEGGGLVGPGEAAPPAPKSKAGIVSCRELAKVLDLSKLPAPKGTEFAQKSAGEVQANVPLAVKPTAEFYLEKFAALGFKPSGEPGSNTVTDEYAQASLVKEGNTVSLSVIKAGDPGKVMVTLYRHGNLDARTLPQTAGAKPLYGSSTSSMYVGKGTVAEEADFIEQALVKAGWQKFDAPNSASAENPDQRMFKYRNQGYVASAYISVAPAQDNKTVVQYQVLTLSHDLPAPPEAKNVEYDDSRLILNCEVPGDVDAVEKFYDKAMPAAGFTPLKSEEPTEDRRLRRFESEDKGIMLVDITTKDHKTTKVQFLWYSPELLAEMKKHEGESEQPAEAESKPAADAIAAREIPLPAEAQDVEYDAKGEEIKFHAKGEIKPLVEALRAKLAPAGWKEDKQFTVTEKNAGVLNLRKGDATLTIVLVNLGLGDGTTATINTSGLFWGKVEKE